METVCPQLSSGPIQDDESVARFVPSDRYYDQETRTVLTNLFEAASQNGMSITRIEKAGSAQLTKQQIDSQYHGYISAKANDIRSIFHEIVDATTSAVVKRQQVFAIYDTALSENPFHGDVCQTIMNPGALGIKLRVRLRDAFGQKIENFNPTSTVRQGP
jgi:isocitrate/isopropylmalate dehydrogenase